MYTWSRNLARLGGLVVFVLGYYVWRLFENNVIGIWDFAGIILILVIVFGFLVAYILASLKTQRQKERKL